MRILVIGPEFIEVEKYLKKIVCVEGSATLTVYNENQVKKVIDIINDYCGDDSMYSFEVNTQHPRRIIVSYKG